MKIGFGAALWVRDEHYENFHRMLDEMALLELDGFEMHYPFLYDKYKDRKKELRQLLDVHQLALTSYYVPIGFSDENQKQSHVAYARKVFEFVADLGYNDVLIDEHIFLRDKEIEENEDHIDLIADTANELGDYAASLGLKMSWHQHWGSIFEDEKKFHKFMKKTDKQLVGFCCDMAHIALCGWEMLPVVKKYADRMWYVHYKDVVLRSYLRKKLWKNGPPIPSDMGAYHVDSYGRFIELGRGNVNFSEITKILIDAGFDGWIVSDFDYTGYSVMESVKASLDYLNNALGIWGQKQQKKKRK